VPGGSIPLVINEAGGLQGGEALIDKDFSAALLAENLQAQGLLLLTDTDGVYESWGTNYAHRFDQTTPKNLRRYRFAAGSMGPKVAAPVILWRKLGNGALLVNYIKPWRLLTVKGEL
jgi:carbamate kinase